MNYRLKSFLIALGLSSQLFRMRMLSDHKEIEEDEEEEKLEKSENKPTVLHSNWPIISW